MLLLTFRIKDQAYAIDVNPVIEVIPYVQLREWPDSEMGVAGLLNYRGTVVPVIDLSLLVGGVGAEQRLSSRIVVVECLAIGTLGLLVEGATEACPFSEESVQPISCMNQDLPCLGDVVVSETQIVQLIDVERLVSERLRELFKQKLAEEQV